MVKLAASTQDQIAPDIGRNIGGEMKQFNLMETQPVCVTIHGLHACSVTVQVTCVDIQREAKPDLPACSSIYDYLTCSTNSKLPASLAVIWLLLIVMFNKWFFCIVLSFILRVGTWGRLLQSLSSIRDTVSREHGSHGHRRWILLSPSQPVP